MHDVQNTNGYLGDGVDLVELVADDVLAILLLALLEVPTVDSLDTLQVGNGTGAQLAHHLLALTI